MDSTTAIFLPNLKPQINVLQIFLITEFVLYILAFFWFCIMAYVFFSVQVFHKHLTAMLSSMFINFYFLVASRVVFIFSSGFDPKLCYAPIRDMLTDFQNFLDVFKYIMCNCFTFALPFLTAERTIATMKLDNYEKTVCRFHLPTALILSWICGGLAGMISMMGDSYFYVVMILMIILNVFAFCIFFFLDSINRSKYKANKLAKCQYSLTTQFQLAENIRYAKLIKKCAIFLTLSVCFEVLALTIAETIDGFKIKGVMSIGLHYAIIFCAVLFSIFALTSIEQYKIKFIK